MASPRGRARPASESRHTFICSWCGVVMRVSPDPDCDTVNYGICPQCLAAQLEALPRINGERAAAIRKLGSGGKGESPPCSQAAESQVAAG
jgi:hypothetical protein